MSYYNCTKADSPKAAVLEFIERSNPKKTFIGVHYQEPWGESVYINFSDIKVDEKTKIALLNHLAEVAELNDSDDQQKIWLSVFN